mmetsp:Transcript_3521/g.5968  ORF Transcript_3521/g.5968 Transcript_3521/m.5968 type:complete len:244 (-) Transcript_3521:310-1041(-)|eukprot:CAMPEP_0198230494 /NCGR_PEP_ID=MMETSP1445-20131203/114693_1 /TAXON_ID=36898 /ORGANISM="Pyramimonas sp., Strain CCMP2087" /LENGTH=243 /DNA_ID=CAMNT_0043911039 /DNA_START=551 /DNA_END=1282 /DNA_ORIENTATION=+
MTGRMGFGHGPMDVPGEPPRMGTQRSSQHVNCLLRKSELGKVKAITTALPPDDFAYGISRARDQEGAREVTFKWVTHKPNPDAKPGPDFKAMNSLAVHNEVIKAKDQRDFRLANPRSLKQGIIKNKSDQDPLPSDYNTEHTYGRQSCHRTLEEFRQTGPTPHMKNIVQGSFQHDWIHKNMMKDESIAHKQRRLPPQTTKASEGHALKTKTLLDPQEKDMWKMKKFTNVQPKVNSNNYSPQGEM